MLILFLIYALIPILILLRVTKTLSKKILWCRFKYALPALILTVINTVVFIYHFFVAPFTLFEDNPLAFLIPGLLLAVVIIIFNAGRKQEKILQTEITSKEIEKVRFRKSSTNRNQLIIESEYDEETEKL